jgi:ABC-type cobalamin/Fe3+-siderophores transport system ATPase subunit
MIPEKCFESQKPIKVGIVGPCGSGKTTLIRLLQIRRTDLELHHIAQEHSYVPTMWKKIVSPDILIYLDVSFSEATNRRRLNWSQSEFQEQISRLGDAKNHADFILQTDMLSATEVADRVSDFIDQSTFSNLE